MSAKCETEIKEVIRVTIMREEVLEATKKWKRKREESSPAFDIYKKFTEAVVVMTKA